MLYFNLDFFFEKESCYVAQAYVILSVWIQIPGTAEVYHHTWLGTSIGKGGCDCCLQPQSEGTKGGDGPSMSFHTSVHLSAKVLPQLFLL